MSHSGALMPLTIGVDVGGTKVLAGVVDAHGQVRARVRRETAGSAPAIVAEVVAAVSELMLGHEIAAVGVSAAGFIAADRRQVITSPNIPAWKNAPLAAEISAAVGLPVVLENDANCAAWGEARFGAGMGHRQVVMITIGTGIGGGIVLDGSLVRGAFGIAGEPGHMAVVPDGLPCGCGRLGCWEQYASGGALLRVAREHGYSGVGGAGVTQAARAGDAAALAAFAHIGEWLGRGLATLCVVLDPSVIILGGGVSEADDLLLEPARDALARHLPASDQRPYAAVERAHWGTDAGFIGAADLARDLS